VLALLALGVPINVRDKAASSNKSTPYRQGYFLTRVLPVF